MISVMEGVNKKTRKPVVDLDEDNDDDMSGRRNLTRWNQNEEMLLAETWIEHSQDANIEKDQQDGVYWNLIMHDFNSGENDADLVENGKTSYLERCGKKIQYPHVWNILKNYPKWNAAEPIDKDNLEELFGLDPRERLAGKKQASKKQKSCDTSSAGGSTGGSTGGSQSESISSLVFQDYRRKCDVAERAYEAKKEKELAIMKKELAIM
ncbi:glutathione S-transferase T3-like protein [Tanacetum coccineum]